MVAASLLRGPLLSGICSPKSFFRFRSRRLPVFLGAAHSYFASPSAVAEPAATASVSTPHVLPRIELDQNQIIIEGRELAVVQPTDVDQVLDMYIKRGKLDGDPYWCRIWPSAIALAEKILKNPQLVANLRVCDLGSGLGLAGISALLAGAKEVVFYDQEPLALLCSLLTVHANIPHAATNLPFFVQQMCSDKTPEYLEYLAYGLALPPEIFQAAGVPKGATLMARAEVFDWSVKRMYAHTFDTVLACDVLYEKTSVSYIADLLPRLVSPGGPGKAILTDPTRRTPQNREEFLRLISKRTGVAKGLRLQRTEHINLTSNDKSEDVELLQFCLP